MVRLFAALPVPFAVAETLAALQNGLSGARWRTAEQLHVTLAFYGELDERRADDLSVELGRIASKPFQITLSGVGAFGEAHRRQTLWAGIEASEPLAVLAGRCRTAAERAGMSVERRAYRPHVTLAYLGAETHPDRLGGWMAEHNLLRAGPMTIDRFGLYASELNLDGSRYTLEQGYRL